MAAIIRDSFHTDVPILLKVGSADEMPIRDVEAVLQCGKNAPLDEVPALRWIIRITRLPMPLRRLFWWFGLHTGASGRTISAPSP